MEELVVYLTLPLLTRKRRMKRDERVLKCEHWFSILMIVTRLHLQCGVSGLLSLYIRFASPWKNQIDSAKLSC